MLHKRFAQALLAKVGTYASQQVMNRRTGQRGANKLRHNTLQ